MAGSRLSGASVREPRRWSFADCVFDEANWTLWVAGRRVSAETKPLELLRALLLRAGELVSKHDLLDLIWPDVAVVEASLPTAIGKLRRALDDDRRDLPIIETVPRIGYRLAVPVEVEHLSSAPSAVPRSTASAVEPTRHVASSMPRLMWIAAGLAVALIASAAALKNSPLSPAPVQADRTFSARKIFNVIRKLDVDEAENMIAAGWKPDVPIDAQGDLALGLAVEICEWDPQHDRRRLVLMARTLLDGGARLDHRNIYGDTAYSIAKAKRFCGPDHPVTAMFRTLCDTGVRPLGDRCMASYELARGQHFVAQPKPKA
jgi:DNA-binding winged helix-turn-helix (wHTH) protein